MIDLLNLQPVKISKDLRGKYIMIYGEPKIGKTTLAASFERNLLLAFEPGYNGLDNAMVQPIGNWRDFKTTLTQLEKSEIKEKFATITIDTADIAWDYCSKYICASNESQDGSIPKTLTDIPWGKGYDLCKKEYDECLRKIALLGYGLIIISHEGVRNVKTEKGEEFQKITPTLPDRPKLIVNRLVDIIAYLRLDPETGIRYLYTRGNERFEAGSRFKYLEPKLEMSYENLANALAEAIEKQAKDNDSVPVSRPIVKEEEKRSFESVIAEAKGVFQKLIEKELGDKMNEIVLKHFGSAIKLSETKPEQQEIVEMVLDEWKTLL